jgi:tetratricopeptide (TPR) repeat protein
MVFLERVSLIDPLYALAYLMKGVLKMNTGDIEEAIKNFQKVIYLDPNSIISHHYLGNLYKNSGDIVKAKREYTNCLDKIEKMEKGKDLPSFTGISVQMLYETTKRALEGIS